MGPELKTEFRISDGVSLRTFRGSDADAVLHWATPDYSIESAREFIENSRESASTRKGLSLGIFQKDRFIGSAGFVKFDWISRKTEMGYWIDQAEEGKGIVSASCRVLIAYAFHELQLNRVEIRCAASNFRSAAIPERLGFQKEGILRQSELRDGRLHDFDIYGLLAAEWR